MIARIARAMCVGAMALAAASVALAQKYPEKPIRIVVPFPPGGNIDITARTVAPGMAEMLGAQVVVDNRGGAAGTIGVDLVAKSPPDGYNLVLGSTGTITGAPSLYPKLPYDPVKDLVAISLVNEVPIMIVVHPAIRAKNMQELVALAKAQPGRMTMGSPGAGSTNHLAGELFQIATGTKLSHIPYKGSGPALIDLMGGQIDLIFDQMTASIGYVKAGKLRAIGLAQQTRSNQLPSVPTLAEQGCKGCDASTFAGIFAPAATPKPIVDRLADVIAKVVASKTVHDRFVSLGAEPKSNTPAEFAQLVKTDIARWARVVKEANIKLD